MSRSHLIQDKEYLEDDTLTSAVNHHYYKNDRSKFICIVDVAVEELNFRLKHCTQGSHL